MYQKKRKEEIRYEMSELASKNGYALSYDTLSRYLADRILLLISDPSNRRV